MSGEEKWRRQVMASKRQGWMRSPAGRAVRARVKREIAAGGSGWRWYAAERHVSGTVSLLIAGLGWKALDLEFGARAARHFRSCPACQHGTDSRAGGSRVEIATLWAVVFRACGLEDAVDTLVRGAREAG